MAFDRMGPRWAYTAGLVVLGGAFLLAGSLDRLWQFYLLVGVSVGVGVSFTGMVPSSGLLSRWPSARITSYNVCYTKLLRSEDDHAYLLEDSGVQFLFVDPGMFAERGKALRGRVPGLKRIFGLGANVV